MASNRQVETPGAAPEPTVDETKSNDEVKTTDQQQPDTTPDDTQAQTGDTGSDAEPTVDQAALIEDLKRQLQESENKNKSLEGQLRRATPAKTNDMAAATTEAPADGKPYLSPKGWTRG